MFLKNQWLSSVWRNRLRIDPCPCGSPPSRSCSRCATCWVPCCWTSWRRPGLPLLAWLYPEVGCQFGVNVPPAGSGVYSIHHAGELSSLRRSVDGGFRFGRCCQTHRYSPKYCSQKPRLCRGHPPHESGEAWRTFLQGQNNPAGSNVSWCSDL